ncbi:MAG: TonB-dependent receptor [Bacteroidales bacterium]|nr:TonB-dependent receptor [Bacteroidales bacterium]
MRKDTCKILEYRILSIIVVCALCLSAHGQDRGAAVDSVAVTQEDTLTAIHLSQISVLASRVPVEWHRQARMVTSISAPAIRNTPSQSINDVLKYSASVDVRQRGPIGAQTDVGIRGGNSEQAAILLNGINISDPQTAHNSFDLPLSVLQVEQIDVLEGPSGKITGSSSLLGTVNVRTFISDTNRLFLNLEGGSYGYLSLGFKYDYAGLRNSQRSSHIAAETRFKNSLSASYTRSDGYSRSSEGHLNMDYKTLKAFYEGQYRDDDVQVNWYAGLSDKDWGSNRFYAARYDEQFEHTFKSFTAVKAQNLKGKLTVSPSLYWNHTNDRFELFRNNPDAYPFNYHKTNVYGANLNNYFRWAGGTTAFGGEIRNEDLLSGNLGEPLDKPKHIKGTDRNYEFGLNRTNTSFFLEHNVITERFTVSAALLAIKNSWAEMDMKVYPSADMSVNLFSRENKMLRLFASYNSSLRMPSVTELYYSVGGHKADKHLKPEEVKALEGGLRFSSATFTSSASVFRNRMTNLIDWIRNTADGEDAPWRSVNFGKIKSTGILLQTSWRPGFHAQYFNLKSLNLAYSYIDQTKGGDASTQSRYTLEYLRHKFVVSADVEIVPSVELSVFWRFQDRTGTFTTTEGEVKQYKPYCILDARLSYLWRHFTFYAEGNNLTDVEYFDHGSIPQPGFWFITGVKFTF